MIQLIPKDHPRANVSRNGHVIATGCAVASLGFLTITLLVAAIVKHSHPIHPAPATASTVAAVAVAQRSNGIRPSMHGVMNNPESFLGTDPVVAAAAVQAMERFSAGKTWHPAGYR